VTSWPGFREIAGDGSNTATDWVLKQVPFVPPREPALRSTPSREVSARLVSPSTAQAAGLLHNYVQAAG